MRTVGTAFVRFAATSRTRFFEPSFHGATIVSGLTPATYRFYHSDFMRQAGSFILIVVLATSIGTLVMRAGRSAGIEYLKAVVRQVDRLHGSSE